ncbi:MAG: Gfo/Idh/MocA family oxidoreductase, partial [Lachnospiraceae bacterium]|nr:Gfo/Idh/MocA family oxidoreductase [Lachnospiraceae bacterium]
MRKLHVGVIGCGAIASIYIHNLKYHFDKVEVVGCSDLLPEKAEEIRAKYDLK